MSLRVLATIFLIVASPLVAVAQIVQPLPDREAFAFDLEAQGGDLVMRWEIVDGYYMYRDYLMVRNARSEELTVETPPGQRLEDPTFGDTEVYYREMVASVPRDELGRSGDFEVTYQGCQESGICYPPITRSFDIASLKETTSVADAPPTSPTSTWLSFGAGNASGAGQAQRSILTETNEASAPSPSSSGTFDLDESAGGGLITSLLQNGGLPWLLGSFVLFGVVLAFTPCVFPMYPILAGALAREGERLSAGRGFALSLTYVLSMASAFGLLGLVAAWSGQNLQLALQSPITIGLVSALFLALALSMFGFFELRLPSTWTNRISATGTGRRGSFPSTALLGFTSALIVGPCVTAPLAGALLYIAQSGDLGIGAAALFALGVGKGIPLVLFGTFGAGALPRAGGWMVAVNRVFGFVFLASAIYMLSRVVPGFVALALWSALLIGMGIHLTAFGSTEARAPTLRPLGKALGAVALVYGGILAAGAATGGSDPLRPLAGFDAQARGGSDTDGTVAFTPASDMDQLMAAVGSAEEGSLVYFTADWCVICRSIERNLFDDPEVARDLNRLRPVKIDVTAVTPEDRAMMEALRVAGPPTMVFLDANGREPIASRHVGEPTKEDLLRSAYRAMGVWR